MQVVVTQRPADGLLQRHFEVFRGVDDVLK